MNPKRQAALAFIAPTAVLLILLATWQLVTVLLDIKPYLLPSPLSVIEVARTNSSELAKATFMTFAGAIGGFLASFIFGCAIAFIFSQSRIVQHSFFPYAIFLQTVPIVAIAPLITIWCGHGFQSVVIVSMIISLFPIITNGTAGLTQIEQQQLDLFSLYGANRWQILLKLRLPNSVPSLVTGAKISSGLSIIGAIVGEFFVGYATENFGLGYLIMMTSGQMNTPYLFATIISSTVLGVAIFLAINFLGDRILSHWRE